jgi:hypothetical protein
MVVLLKETIDESTPPIRTTAPAEKFVPLIVRFCSVDGQIPDRYVNVIWGGGGFKMLILIPTFVWSGFSNRSVAISGVAVYLAGITITSTESPSKRVLVSFSALKKTSAPR